MCGIAGCFHPNGSASLHLGPDMAARLQHRGPDAIGTWSSADGRALLVHTRLSIIDVDSRSNQPFLRGRTVTVFNGEIYNYRRLRSELTALGERFVTEGDTEVIAAGFARWGQAMFSKLRGMYAIAIYQQDSAELVVARDVFGIKPLYYFWVDGEFRFGSEIKSLFVDEPPAVNEATLWDLATFGYRFGNETIFQGVQSLPPGEVLRLKPGPAGLVVQRQVAKRLADLSDCESRREESLGELLQSSVHDHLISDVPVAVALSGGLDSSLVASLAQRMSPDIRAYTSTLAAGDDPEVTHASLLCRARNIPHRVIQSAITEPERFFDDLCWHLEEPIPNIALLTSYFIGKALREDGFKVVLVGEGADELFAGYPWHAMALAAESERNLPALFASYRQRRSQHEHILPWLTAKAKPGLLDRACAQFQLFRECFSEAGRSPLAGFLLFEQRYQLETSQLMRVDRMYMAHAVEARVPFLYDSLAAFAQQLPDGELMLPNPRGKWGAWLARRSPRDKICLRKAARRTLPPAIANRAKFGKQGTINMYQSNTNQAIAAFLLGALKETAFSAAREAYSPFFDWPRIGREVNQIPSKVQLFLGLLLGTMKHFQERYRRPNEGDLGKRQGRHDQFCGFRRAA